MKPWAKLGDRVELFRQVAVSGTISPIGTRGTVVRVLESDSDDYRVDYDKWHWLGSGLTSSCPWIYFRHVTALDQIVEALEADE